MTDAHAAQPEDAQPEDAQPEIDEPDEPLGASTRESADEPLKALRGVIISCLVFYLVFALAFPKLRELSEEEQILPDLIAWSALEGAVRGEGAKRVSELGMPFKALNLPNWERDIAKTADGQSCYKPWIRKNSGIGAALVHESECPRLLPGVDIPGHGIGHLVLLYTHAAPDGSPVERIFFPYFFVFPGARPEDRDIPELPAQNYAIVKMRLPPGAPAIFPFLVVPRAEALAQLDKKMNGGAPGVLPFVGPVNFALADRVLWRAGKRGLLSPTMTPAQLEELDTWLSGRSKNPPQISVFGASIDLTLTSSLLGLILALFAFAMVGPVQDLQRMRGSGHSVSWTMTSPTAARRHGIVLEWLACLFSCAFVFAPIAFVGLQIGYGILRPLESTADLLIGLLNCVAGIAAAVVFAVASLELRRRRRRKPLDDFLPAAQKK